MVVVGNTLVLGTEDGYLNWIAIDSGEIKKRIRFEEGRRTVRERQRLISHGHLNAQSVQRLGTSDFR